MTLLRPRRYAHFILSLFLLIAFRAVAGEAPPQPPLALTAENLASVIDPLVAEWINESKGAGAVVAVTTREGLLFAKGYGRADIESGAPFTADATLVRPGSISKLFTGLAVMQLVDQGKLDLDLDISDYLDFKIPIPEGGVPVTLRRLLTHRAGFEEHAKNLFSKNPEPEPLGRWVARSLPPRLFPKGDVSAYSNYGFALAGYIVERVSGEPFAAYVSRHILEPLGMAKSTFQQPLPNALSPMMAKGYRMADNPLGFFETIAAAPAGSLSATGTDMARFMRALLNRGSLDGVQILSETHFDEMTSPQDQTAAGQMGLAFFGTKLHQYDAIGHGGATLSFVSHLDLFPDQQLGVFVSFDGGQSARKAPQIASVIVDRFLPKRLEANGSTEPMVADSAIAGVYLPSRRADSTFLKGGTFLGQLLLSVDNRGKANVSAAIWPFGAGVEVKRVGANLYEGPRELRFAFEPKEGKGRFVAPAMEFQRAAWHEDARFVAPAMTASILVLLLTLLAWPFAALWRRRRKRVFSEDLLDRRMHAAVRLIALIDAVVIAAFAAFFFAGEYLTLQNDSFDPFVLILYGLAWLGVLGAVPCLLIAISFWRRNVGGWWAKAHHTVIAMSTMVIAWFFVAFHLAGTTLNY